MLSGRLRGGFLASTLPTYGNSSSSSSDSNDGGIVMSPNAAQPVAGEQSSGLQSTSIVTFLTAIKESTARVERRLHVIEQTQAKLTDSIRELQSMVKSQEKETFCIKGSTYELPLKEEMARLFCASLTRDPIQEDIQAAIVKVIGRVFPRDRHKVEVALKFCKKKLTEYRSEERRKVLGQVPFKETCYLSTRSLARQLMQKMHAPEDIDENIYIRNLALFRKFVRLTKSDKEATYMTFRQWLGAASISEDMWSTVVEEDENFDYQNVGVGRDVVVAHEVEIASTDADEDDSID